MMISKVNSILDSIKKVDIETYEHLERTALLSFALAKNINLGPKEMEQAYFAGLIHDIGVLEVQKTDRGLVAKYGSMMLRFVDGFGDISKAIKYQHDYSLLNEGEFSYLLAQIVSIANTYDELRHQESLSHNDAKNLLIKSNFKKDLIDKFIEIIETEELI